MSWTPSEESVFVLLVRWFHEFHFADASSLVPVLNVEVALVVKAQSVGGGENTRLLIGWFDGELGPLCFVGVVTYEGNDVAFFIQNSNSGLKLSHRAVVTMKGDGAGPAQPGSVFTDPISLQVKMDQATLFTVTDQ